MMLNPFLWLILQVLDLYFWIVIATVAMSWLVAFNVINGANPYVRQVANALRRLTEPVMGPIRRLLPDLGGIDVSPIVVLVGLQFLKMFVQWLFGYGMMSL